MVKRDFVESTLGLSSGSEPKVLKFYQSLTENYGGGLANSLSSIFKSSENAAAFLESVNTILDEDDFSGKGLQNSILREDAMARRVSMQNATNELLAESATDGITGLRPISLTSFGFQIRSYIKSQMYRAVKTVTAEKPGFKITERKQFIIDVGGTKRYFTEAFNNASTIMDSVHSKFNMVLTVPSSNYNIFTVNSIDTRNKLSTDLSVASFTAMELDGTTAATALAITSKKRDIDIETGTFSIALKFGTDNATAVVMGEIDFANNIVTNISSTSPRVKTVTFAARLSSETHLQSMVVGMEHKLTPVNIPDNTHIEVELTQEYTDDATKMLGVNVLEEYTNMMGIAIEKLEDMSIFTFLKTLDAGAIVKDTFDCTPETGFLGGREAWIKAEFHPFIERICIRLKAELQMDDCHFRVVGNPIDIRIPNSSGEEYIFRRNQEMTGTSKVDYDFAVVTSGNTIFYLSTERVPAGTVRINLIPNSIENNIITVNHYRYASYISNKYRSSRNAALPTVLVSSRYKTQEYIPIVAVVTISNNKANYYTGGLPIDY